MQVPLMLLRSICTSAVRYSRNGIPTVIKEFPITLRISLPHYDEPVSFSFTSFADISEFLAPKDFFIHPSSRRAIRYNQVKDVNPNVVYDWFSGWMCYDQNLPLRERVKDVVPFDKQAISTLKTILAKEDPSFKELPGKGVVKDKEGKVVAEWKAIFQLSDGCVVFLEAQHHMTIVSIYICYSQRLYALNIISRMLTISRNVC